MEPDCQTFVTSSTAVLESEPARGPWSPRRGVRLVIVLLLAATALPIVGVTLAVICGCVQWTLPAAKLRILAAEYLLLLPVALYVGWRFRMKSPLSAPAPTSFVGFKLFLSIALFAAILLPLAFGLQLGRYQGDESAYLFQARCINTGKFYAPRPPSVPLHTIAYAHHLVLGNKWLGKYPPGWPLVLSLGTLTGLEWLVNPLLAIGVLILTCCIGRAVADVRASLYGTAILAFSAFFVLNCLGFMSHVLSSLLLAVAVLLLFRMLDSPHWIYTLGMFLCLAATALVRPFTALCTGAALIIAWKFTCRRSALLSLFAWGCVLALVVAAMMAAENLISTGNILQSAYSAYNHGHMDEVSFGIKDLVHGLSRITPVRLADTASVGFPFAYFLAVYAVWRRRNDRRIWTLALAFLSLVAGYTVQLVDSDAPIGERYYFEAYFALALLAGLGFCQLASDWNWSSLLRRSVLSTLLLSSLAVTAMCAYWEVNLRWVSRQLALTADHPPINGGIVFVEGTDRVASFNLNFNRPGSPILFLIDPGLGGRASVAAAAGVRNWVCLFYNEQTRSAQWSNLTIGAR